MKASIAVLCNGTAWSPWLPLKDSWRGEVLPTCPGLYRICLVDRTQRKLAYIGQSGSGLKERIYALRHVYEAAMPFKVPHTAGPALWAWRQKVPDAFFEVSVAPFPSLPDVLRLGLECLAIALVRQSDQASPLCQFGRMPEGYAPSSGNDGRLVLLGRRYRGHETSQLASCHLPGCVPAGPLDGDPHAREWCGHHWTPWITLHRMLPVGESGLYRLRVGGLDPLVFLGQGNLAERLKAVVPVKSMECSWVTQTAWSGRERLESLTDLIGAHVLSTAALPLWQFEPSHDGPGGKARRRVS